MKFNSKLLALFAIFCLIASAGVVCAEDIGGYAGSNYYNSENAVASQGPVDLGDGIQYSPSGPEPGAGLPLENQTASAPMNATGSATGHTVGNSTANATGNATANVTVNATHNTTNATAASTLLSTGHPILFLVAFMALIGGYATILRRHR